MAYVDLLPKREFLEQLSLEGKIWKLERETYRGPEDITNWEHCFLMSLDEEWCENGVQKRMVSRKSVVVKNFRILWRSTDDRKSSEWPILGIAGNLSQLKCLMKDDRIHRDDIGIDEEVWNQILELDEVKSRGEIEVKSRGNDDTNVNVAMDESKSLSSEHEVNVADFKSLGIIGSEDESLDSNESDIIGTPDYILEALDKIVTFLTGKYYNTYTEVGAKYEAYIRDYESNLRVMELLWNRGCAFLPNNLVDAFKCGIITSWKGLIGELKDYFDCNENRRTMIDLFAELTTIAMEKYPMKSKLQIMRNKISHFFITEPKDFLTCTDSRNFKTRQTKSEEYSPIVNTLLTCIIYMTCPLPKSKWREMHDNYFKVLRKRPSYKNWHENRLDFYEMMGSELGPFNRGEKCGYPDLSDKGDGSNDVKRDTHINIGAENQNFENSSRCDNNQKLIGQIRANSENFYPKHKLFVDRPRIPKLPSRNDYVENTSRGQNNDLIHVIPPKCTHCSKLRGKTVRHIGPYQGRGDKCLFDVNGRPKTSNSRVVFKENFEGAEDADFTETKDCIYVHSVFEKKENLMKKGFGESKKSAARRGVSRGDAEGQQNIFEKKVEKVPLNTRLRDDDEINDLKKFNEINDLTFVRDACKENNVVRDNLRNNSKCYLSRRDGKCVPSRCDQGSIKSDKHSSFCESDLKPSLNCTFRDINRPNMVSFGTVTLDSGADYSMVHISKLKYCQYWRAGKREKPVKGAGGEIIPCADFTVNIAMEIGNLGIFILKNVLVSTSYKPEMRARVLLGVSDLNRLKIVIDFEEKRVRFGVGPNHEKWVNMKPPVLRS